MTRPFVSVLIDTYNHERFIEDAVGSVLAQDFPACDREIVVVDDGSKDTTPDILKKFEPAVRVIRKTNGGQGSAFNFGIPACKGEYIAFLDGDDWWVPEKLRIVTGALAANSCVGMVGHAFYQNDKNGQDQVVTTNGLVRISLNDAKTAHLFRLCRCYFGTSRLILKAEVARRCLPVPEKLIFEADEFLFTIAACVSDSLILPEPLTHYRVHDANLFVNPGAEGERRKQRVIESLGIELRKALSSKRIPPDAMEKILEIVEAEAVQLRLKLDGGYPWETFRTESTIYRIQHSHASASNKFFRALSMIPALLLPPRMFYEARHWLSSQGWYARFRKETLTPPEIHLPERPMVSSVSQINNQTRR